ncbi:MAG: prephenate dehydrogenase [bacterium]
MKITIIGTGLIGCSLGMALKKQGHYITGADSSADNLEKALFRGGIDEAKELTEALKDAQLVALCVPVNVVKELIVPVLDAISDHAVLMDMGSTKEEICGVADGHPRRADFVAAHPMAGVEHSGPMAAHIDLFLHARVIVCDAQKSATHALNTVLGIFQELKMKVIFMDSRQHDHQLALVSHLPQFIAYALSAMDDFGDSSNKDWVELGGGGLQSSIRLGKSDAGMWIPVFQQNKENVLRYIDRYMHKLQEMKYLLETRDDLQMLELIRTSNRNYEKLNYRNNQPETAVPDKEATKLFYS